MATRYWKAAAALLLFAAATNALAADSSPGKWPGGLPGAMKDLFDGAMVRTPGSAGNLETEKRVAAAFAASGFTNGAITFRAPCYFSGAAELTVGKLSRVPLLAMHPSLMRPGNFSQRDMDTDLVYLGRGGVADLAAAKGIGLSNCVAVLEMQCEPGWYDLMRFGLSGFIFLGSEDELPDDAISKVTTTEARIPCYYLAGEDAGDLRAALKASGVRAAGRIHAEPSRWENRLLRDLWVYIPGSDPVLGKDVMVITAQMDSDSVVPSISEGAQCGANLYLLMQLLEEFRKNRPARSVMLVAVNAHTQNLLGERMLAWHLLAPGAEIEEARNTIAKEIEHEELMLRCYSELTLEPSTRKKDNDYLIELRSKTDKSTGRFVTIKEPLVAVVRRDVNILRGKQIEMFRQGLSAEEATKRRDEMETERQKYVKVLTLFNKFGNRTTLDELYDTSPESVDILRRYVKEIMDQNRRWAEMNRADLALDSSNTPVRTVLEGRSVALVVCLDFDWTSTEIGFYSMEGVWDNSRWQARFGRNMAQLAEALPLVKGDKDRNLLVDTLTRVGGLKEDYYFPVKGDGIQVFHSANATPAFSFRNVYSAFGRVFTPCDTFARLDPVAVGKVTEFVPQLFRSFLDAPDVTNPDEMPRFQRKKTRQNTMWAIRMKTFKFDEFAASVLPSLPVPGCMFMMVSGGSKVAPDGVVWGYTALTDDRAATMIYGISDEASSTPLLTTAYHYDPDFVNVDFTLDAGEVHQRVPTGITRTTARVMALFACRELPIYSRDDSSALGASGITIPTYQILNARRHVSPRRYGFWGASDVISVRQVPASQTGPACYYVEENEYFKLLTASKLTALNATEKEPLGTGYSAATGIGADFFRTIVNDMSVLNSFRVDNLRGVSDELTKDFLKRGDEARAVMESAWASHDYLVYLRKLYSALGSHVKAYAQTAAITNDMLKAVVFYMAVMLPFCFFVQKLVFKFVRIEAQMGMFVLIFVATFIVFRMIHPAFRIAQAPEAMFVAFVMGGLGFFVISVLHSRFEGEMQLLFQTYTGMDTADVGYSTVTQQAMLIGVNNMKRRRIRTTLTTATIVLVTFTMLAFSSISKKMSPTIVPKGKKAPYTGLMYHWPGQMMDRATAQVMERLYHGRADVNLRYWLMSPRILGSWQPEIIPFHVASLPDKRTAQIFAVLGLSMLENGFIEPIPMVPGSRYFSSEDADEVILPSAIADTMGVTPGNMTGCRIVFKSREYKVVGILDDDRFRSIRDIDDRPLLPVQVKKQGSDKAAEELTGAVEEEGGAGVEYVDTSSMVVMPSRTLARIGGQPYSVSVRFKDDDPIWPHVEELLTATHAKFYVSSRLPFQAGAAGKRKISEGVYYMGTGYRTSIGGLSKLIIPLLIASTIILNTMLGAVYERKSEIAVYNAVGLNPTHIGTFFLAEAFVYSVIGSVGGYLIGQILSITLSKLGWVKDINLNFSSLSVVYVIIFTIAVVMLSTLYPAHMATKAAVPSGKRKWSLPPHDGKRMQVPFPFIYRADLATGILAYLDEYFSRFTEASLSDLIAHGIRREVGKDEKGRPVYNLLYHVALAPFDLGVTQDVTFVAKFDERVQSYRVTMDIERVSGQDTNWAATNKPFLERLRQYLLHWRNVSSAQHGVCVEHGNRMFKTADRV